MNLTQSFLHNNSLLHRIRPQSYFYNTYICCCEKQIILKVKLLFCLPLTRDRCSYFVFGVWYLRTYFFLKYQSYFVERSCLLLIHCAWKEMPSSSLGFFFFRWPSRPTPLPPTPSAFLRNLFT